jgi:hypothetical protein
MLCEMSRRSAVEQVAWCSVSNTSPLPKRGEDELERRLADAALSLAGEPRLAAHDLDDLLALQLLSELLDVEALGEVALPLEVLEKLERGLDVAVRLDQEVIEEGEDVLEALERLEDRLVEAVVAVPRHGRLSPSCS